MEMPSPDEMIYSLILPILSFMALLNSEMGIIETLSAEISFFFLSLSLFSFSSIFLKGRKFIPALLLFTVLAILFSLPAFPPPNHPRNNPCVVHICIHP